MTLVITFIVCLVLISEGAFASRLSVSGDHFVYNGEKVFLSGGSLPWINYAHDFGNNQWAGVKSQVENQMKMLRDAGGNTMRLWIHIQGGSTPQFDNNGYVTDFDKQGTFMNDFKDMLNLAQRYDILVVPTLWSAAVNQDRSHHLDGLLVDWRKLTSYINKVLVPLVRAVKGHPALGAWDIFNEPEGMLKIGESHDDPCFDTTKLSGSGAGWAGKRYNYYQILRFINWQADAIKKEDPEVLVTIGVWNPKSCTNNFGLANHYSDACLYKAGKRQMGKLDFYQFHTYSWAGKFDNVSPFVNKYSDYGTSKPIVIGEFNKKNGGGRSFKQLFEYAYGHGYAGAWSWDLVSKGRDERYGISLLKDHTENGKIPIHI
ncbi:hypothetical protein RRG08_033025 [Elysia crispata]|uniref:Mannan endo-1,4-beta-mannosidase n=1 Tax=Elysia crispata TaxID=231223 RepID=A0AAE1AE19_9GAST|nr:hypothetical protein RRG08_033025 [Elysia crispata]